MPRRLCGLPVLFEVLLLCPRLTALAELPRGGHTGRGTPEEGHPATVLADSALTARPLARRGLGRLVLARGLVADQFATRRSGTGQFAARRVGTRQFRRPRGLPGDDVGVRPLASCLLFRHRFDPLERGFLEVEFDYRHGNLYGRCDDNGVARLSTTGYCDYVLRYDGPVIAVRDVYRVLISSFGTRVFDQTLIFGVIVGYLSRRSRASTNS